VSTQQTVRNALRAAGLLKRAPRETCTCKSYAFPHRLGGGKCRGDEAGPFCGCCGEPCEAENMDFGYGPLEAWGQRFTHRDVHLASTCCEAEVFADAALTKPYDE
jgi:hypothetical protein